MAVWLPHIRLLQPLLSCRLLFKSCCQVQEETRARACGSARTHTGTNTQQFFFLSLSLSDEARCSQMCKVSPSAHPQSGQVDFVQTPRRRVTRHDGGHKTPLSAATISSDGLRCHDCAVLSAARFLTVLHCDVSAMDRINSSVPVVGSGTCLGPGAHG